MRKKTTPPEVMMRRTNGSQVSAHQAPPHATTPTILFPEFFPFSMLNTLTTATMPNKIATLTQGVCFSASITVLNWISERWSIPLAKRYNKTDYWIYSYSKIYKGTASDEFWWLSWWCRSRACSGGNFRVLQSRIGQDF
jgi:hypothetical protein